MKDKKGWFIIPQIQVEELKATPYPIEKILARINFSQAGWWKDLVSQTYVYLGYCDLFRPLQAGEKIPEYTLRVDLKENEPIIEAIER